MEICNLCAGEGLIGAGETPSLRLGKIVTCGDCNGSGKVGGLEEVMEEETIITPEEETAPAAEESFLEESSDASSEE